MTRLQAGDKPIDFGHGGIAGCLSHTGRIIALSRYHPLHGYVTLSSLPPFPDSLRYDQSEVRAYRRKMLQTKGIGLKLADVIEKQVAFSVDDAPILHLTLAEGLRATCITRVLAPHGIVQHWQFSDVTRIRFDGTGYLMRHPYPQLTEGGVLPHIPSDVTDFIIHTPNGAGFGVYNEALGVAVGFGVGNWGGMPSKTGFRVHYATQADQFVVMIAFADAPDDFHTDTPVRTAFSSPITINHLPVGTAYMPSDDLTTPTPVGTAYMPSDVAPSNGRDESGRDESGRDESGRDISRPYLSDGTGMIYHAPSPAYDIIEHRAHTYARLCAMPSAQNTVCILTDHMILPLSWNRDAYYTARLWLTDPATYPLVRGHLLWMFTVAERVNGLWGRSYLANGRVKDKGFQLDQQVFPLLELAEYVQITGDVALYDALQHHIPPLLQALEAHRAPHALLYATEETPADDPIALPYPLSSQVLLWYTVRQLVSIGYAKFLPATPDALRDAICTHFIAIAPNADQPLYAYATDGAGHHHFYHDANDIPLALMPAWGFCDASDPVWRATVDFAFSSANVEGYYAGVLGSVHTPAPWTLGDLQEWIVARALCDVARADRVLARLHHAMQWDGALCEAYDAQTGAVVSRHWFLWTNALYACIKRGVFDVT